MKMSKFQEINDKLKDTRYFLINKYDNAATIKKKLATKFDSENKKYGMMFAYFILDEKLYELLNKMNKSHFNDKAFYDGNLQRLLDEYCQFGFEIIDISLKDRTNHVITDIILDIYPFAEWKSVMVKSICNNITDSALYLEMMTRYGIREYKKIPD